jgi:hypothetical protein
MGCGAAFLTSSKIAAEAAWQQKSAKPTNALRSIICALVAPGVATTRYQPSDRAGGEI